MSKNDADMPPLDEHYVPNVHAGVGGHGPIEEDRPTEGPAEGHDPGVDELRFGHAKFAKFGGFHRRSTGLMILMTILCLTRHA